MDRLSFDWNCVIEVEESRSQSVDVVQLVHRHRVGQLEVGLLATSASENLKGSSGLPTTPQAFQSRLLTLGWSDLPIIPTAGVWGMTFWGSFFWAGDSDAALISALWSSIAKPGIPQNHNDFAATIGLSTPYTLEQPEFSKWRNVWCDVYSAHAHIHAGRDVFITTNTKDFQANAKKLAGLGLRRIHTPNEYLALHP